MKHKITTTIEPDREIEVDSAEYEDLREQGLIKEDRTAKKDRPKQEGN